MKRLMLLLITPFLIAYTPYNADLEISYCVLELRFKNERAQEYIIRGMNKHDQNIIQFGEPNGTFFFGKYRALEVLEELYKNGRCPY